MSSPIDSADALIQGLRQTSDDEEQAPIIAELIELCRAPGGGLVREHLEQALKGELLQVQWALEEVIEAVTPKKEAPAAPEPPPAPVPEAPKQLSAKDLVVIYDNPRGLMLHKTKVGDRWFATQVEPRSGQPQTFELMAQEIAQLKTQLKGSPYWVVGAG